jgi:hypothetical protein|tara:strand:- start:214 stop:429 length:216 start_codon:yes stop_codon:yes gene_type:complete
MSWFDIVKRLRGNQSKDVDYKTLRNKKELQAKASKNIRNTDTEKIAPLVAAGATVAAGAANLLSGKKKKKE